MKNLFKNHSANKNNPKWENIISRKSPLYFREKDVRSPFERDYTRIIHSNEYRRLKHKTQVFFSPNNDHLFTRSEHVTHVDSISYTIANYLGLNTELTKAIATAHDIGHSPFGHAGERILSDISQKELRVPFWHEKNGVTFVDKIELLEDENKFKQNLNLTYGVRDGIISHCGEIDENILKPRDEFIDLNDYSLPNQYSPYTWEGCVVKIADKISYIGRDIEDAITLGILEDFSQELYDIINKYSDEKFLNNTIIINYLVSDLCVNSSVEKGLCFSPEAFNLLTDLKKFNYQNIYFSNRVQPSLKYFDIVIHEIYDTLKSTFDGKNSIDNIKKLGKFYPKLSNGFLYFLYNYIDFGNRESLRLKNDIIFDYTNEKDYVRAILCYISGMTDNFAIEMYNEIIGF